MKIQNLILSIAKGLMVMALCMPSLMYAQGGYDNTPVEVSKEKVRIDGQICYSHIVLEKQTLYSISKAYGVSIEDIYRLNPSVKESGLKKNSIILIPAIEEPSRPEEDVMAPAQEEAPEIQKEPTRTHTVKWFEDIDGIAAKYGVSVNAIMKANGLNSRKLAKRQKLIIPAPGEYEDTIATETELMAQQESGDTTAVADSTVLDEDALFPGWAFSRKEVDMSLLLPLKADGSNSSRQNMDFYSGVLLAVHDMAKEGVSTKLNVYDIAEGGIPAISERASDSDIIIGPVSPADITSLFEHAPEAKAVISPLDPRAGGLVEGRSALIQAPAPHMIQYTDLVSWIKEDMMPQDRCLVITEKGARPTDAVTGMTAAIDSAGVEYRPLSYSILEGRNVTASLEYLMTETGTNRVYIASESEAFVNDVVRNLNLMIYKKYNVVLYAPSKIRSFETIEVENFHNTKMHVSMGYYIDYEDAMVKEFLLRYRALFNTEPTQFAFQGYDIARYFISMYSKYGNRWIEKIDDNTTPMLQSTFKFKKAEDGGYTNYGVRRIIYDNGWNVRKVR